MKFKKNITKKDDLKLNAKKIVAKAKQLNLIKPLSSAFDDVPCKKEEHKGEIKSYCK